jgi:hypothetical protein
MEKELIEKLEKKLEKIEEEIKTIELLLVVTLLGIAFFAGIFLSVLIRVLRS